MTNRLGYVSVFVGYVNLITLSVELLVFIPTEVHFFVD